MIGLALTDNLRITDNPTIAAAAQRGKQILLFVLFTKEQLSNSEQPSARFFVDAVRALSETVPVSTFYGPMTMYATIIRQHKIEELYITKGHTPFAKKRARYLNTIMKGHLVQIEDRLLDWSALAHEYQVFSAFRNALQDHHRQRTRTVAKYAPTVSREWPAIESSNVVATRAAAMACMRHYFRTLGTTRTRPSSKIGVYVRFGIISPRELWALCERQKHDKRAVPYLVDLQQGLVWREFFHYMTDRLGFTQLKPYRGPKWLDMAKMPHAPEKGLLSAKTRFGLWCRGETGQAFVDAGMRQMAREGIMHNRLRMVTANYLVQHLRCNWRWGERFFAKSLLDYDSGLNCWNWQFIAGTGTDRYVFRPFNPDTQAKKHPDVVEIL
jgi:deoxyribodipyrimidine photo-lyase